MCIIFSSHLSNKNVVYSAIVVPYIYIYIYYFNNVKIIACMYCSLHI